MPNINPSLLISNIFQRVRRLEARSADLKLDVGSWLRPPQFDDPEVSRHAKTLYIFLLITPIASNLIAIPLLSSSTEPPLIISIFILKNIVVVTSLIFIHHKKMLLGAGLFLFSMWLIVTYAIIFLHGDISNPSIGAYLLIILGAGLFIGPRMAITFTGLAWLSIAGFMVADHYHWIPLPRIPITGQRYIIMQILVFALGLVLIFVAIESTRKAIQRSLNHENDLQDNNRHLQNSCPHWNNEFPSEHLRLPSKNSSMKPWSRIVRLLLCVRISTTPRMPHTSLRKC